jgi:anti-sigma B factor antagonist
MATTPTTQPVTPFSIHASSANRKTTVTCSGRLTVSSAANFVSEIKQWIDCSSIIVADLGGLTYLDSAGLGAVVSAYTSAKKAACEFQLVNVTPRVMHLLQLTNLATVLKPTTENLL